MTAATLNISTLNISGIVHYYFNIIFRDSIQYLEVDATYVSIYLGGFYALWRMPLE